MSNPQAFTPPKFIGRQNSEFFPLLKKRVNEYFQSKNISKYSNKNMVFKTVFMILLYTVPYFGMMFIWNGHAWQIVLSYMVMGFGLAGIGFSIMHDANHGSYSKHKLVNRTLGYLLDAVGGSSINWRIQHNIKHHTYTNVHQIDEDIKTAPILRFSPNEKIKPIHRFQFIYAWFLYGLMTIWWVFGKDVLQLIRYNKEDLIKTQHVDFKKSVVSLIVSKLIYLTYILVIPVLVLGNLWYAPLIGFFALHFIAGLFMAIVFQPAHVLETTQFPTLDQNGRIDNVWAIHQLQTTANFAPKSRLLHWFIGGLNFQIEHHLFPNVCHVHYKNISKIVQETSAEFGLPYISYSSFGKALFEHTKMLKSLGKAA